MTTPSFRAGLVVLGVLSTADLLVPLLSDGDTPPMAVALAAAALGLVSLALVVSAWRGAARAVLPLVVLRVLSALAAAPGLVASGVPTPLRVAAGAAVVLTVVGVALVLPARVTAGAR